MNKTHVTLGLIHSNAFVQATTCFLLAAGLAQPVMAVGREPYNETVTVVQQNEITVTGTIRNVDGTPVIGASVVEKGTSNGTVSDVDGH